MKNKTDKIRQWLNDSLPQQMGNLRLGEDRVYTYNVLLARVERFRRFAFVNTERYSKTSSGHRNMLVSALKLEGYHVIEVDDPQAAEKTYR